MSCEISLEQFVTLHALILTCEKLDESYFGPLNTLGSPFSPGYEFGYELIKQLINVKLIKPKQPKFKDFMTFTKTGKEPAYAKVNWVILFDGFEAYLKDITKDNINSNSIHRWKGEVAKFQQKLAFAECREFYEYCLNIRNLIYDFDNKTEVLIVNLLNDHSVSQCYQIFWDSAKYTVDFRARNPKIYKTVISIMNEACIRYSNRAKEKNWQIKGFDRNVNLPRNMINYVLYEIILMSEDSGFTNKVYKN